MQGRLGSRSRRNRETVPGYPSATTRRPRHRRTIDIELSTLYLEQKRLTPRHPLRHWPSLLMRYAWLPSQCQLYDRQWSLPFPKYLTSDNPLTPPNNVEERSRARRLVQNFWDREPLRMSTLSQGRRGRGNSASEVSYLGCWSSGNCPDGYSDGCAMRQCVAATAMPFHPLGETLNAV